MHTLGLLGDLLERMHQPSLVKVQGSKARPAAGKFASMTASMEPLACPCDEHHACLPPERPEEAPSYNAV